MNLKKIIKKFIPHKYHSNIVKIIKGYGTLSYSQEGEDLLLKRLFESKNTKGYFVDVGAHHPKRFSNTYLFYKMGWQGINIDAMPGSMKLFDSLRPNDINIEKPISDTKQILTYYAFEEPALNTLSMDLGEYRITEAHNKLLFKREIETDTLESILEQYLPINKTIDFLSIDVEGLDFQVLKSNNWFKYKPTVVVVEAYESSLIEVMGSEIYLYLTNFGYEIVAKTPNSVIYKLSK
jgi:FkbM family methyltransferase